jgi:hypothetical protein
MATDIIISGNRPLTMSSRDIAELVGKRHDNVMRDIRVMLEELYPEGVELRKPPLRPAVHVEPSTRKTAVVGTG